MAHWLGALAGWLYRRRWETIAFWIVVLAVACLGAGRIEQVLIGGSGAIPASQSAKVDERLARDFDNPFAKSLIVTFHSAVSTVEDPAYARVVADAATRLRALPFVRKVVGYAEAGNPRLRSDDGHSTVLLVGIAARDVREEEKRLPPFRAALTPVRRSPDAQAIAMHLATTGRSALMVDVNVFNATDSQRAEGRTLPLVLVILLVAFGSLAAAGVPLVMGVVATTVALGVAFLLGRVTDLSNLTQNIATMLGLAVGIDYSLLMVNRYREAVAAGRGAAEALAETLQTAGASVLVSGAAVVVGLSGLLLTPLFETQSVGVGGILVLAIAILVALTLVPALLAVIGPRVDWPPGLSRALRAIDTTSAWRRWAYTVMNHPKKSLALAVLLVATLAYPARHWVSGFPSQKWFPPAMEARQGLDVLAKMNQGWSIFPIYLLVRAPEAPVTSTRHLAALLRLSRTLHAQPEVDSVYGPVDVQPGLSPLAYAMLYRDLDRTLQRYPDVGQLFLSHDRRSALFQVVLKDSTTLEQAKRLVRQWQELDPLDGLQLEVGGQAVFYNDYDLAMNRSFPWVVGFVLAATFLVLALAYRSWLIPLKAIAMNLMSVAAGYGAVSAVFLMGWGKQLLGLRETIDGVPQAIPLIIFCVVFGLSMDYEVFLLGRVKEFYDLTGDNRKATAEGLARTGGIITSAALIMAVVFGAFAGAEMVIVKMLGFGLAIAVLVDATVIRCVAVPAFMVLAGKWNWVPGARGRRIEAIRIPR